VTKKWGKKRKKQFVLKHTNSAGKIVGEKSSEKMQKKVFYIHTNIVTKKGGKKRALQFF